jgi:hypothetical protein
VDNIGRANIVPVVALDNDGVLAEVLAREVPVVKVEGTLVVDDLGEVLDDLRIISDLVVAGEANEIATKAVKATTELLEDDGLGLNLADSLGDDPGRTWSVYATSRIYSMVLTSWPSPGEQGDAVE